MTRFLCAQHSAAGPTRPAVAVIRYHTTALAAVVHSSAWRNNFLMRAVIGLVVVAGVLLGFYAFSLKKLPATDFGTARTQAISLTGVRSDLLSIANAERGNVALNSQCASLPELISSGSLSMSRPERDGYTYEVRCNGDGGEFAVTARHAPAPEGSPIRYPILAIDQNMQIGEVQ